MAYTVTLLHFPAAPPDVIHAAEARFRAALDKALADRVAPTLRAFQSASESSANELTKDEVKLVGNWATAYAKAMSAGFRGLGDADAAYFEVRLA
ncbi:hypothetical protein [Variovorax sp. LT1R16]|uniref:hypothetical protein n=1 Tax=Variovorax sp. LT1R16 TaxID=3443728 RepID=UPI003F4717DB